MTGKQVEKRIDILGLSKSLKLIKVSAERGTVMLSAAKLDDCLEDLLRGFFIDNKKACDGLLDEPGPLSTFGARIGLACSLGLISQTESDTLNLIRRIRNDFGHSADTRSFHTPPIRDRCLALDPPPKLWQIISNRALDPDNPEERFLASVTFLLAGLLQRQESIPRCQVPPPITDEGLASFVGEALKEPTTVPTKSAYPT